MIKEHNANPERTFDMAINNFHDKHESELFFGLDTSALANISLNEPDLATAVTFSYPSHVDWSQRDDVVSAIKNQKSCGSCWAFSSVAAVESALAL